MKPIALPLEDEIHVWLIDEHQVFASLDVLDYLPLLSADEYARYKRLQIATHKRQFLVTRAAVRAMFSQYVPELMPSQWVFIQGARGRPELNFAPLQGQMSFNISHARGMLVIAVSAGGALGVDVEWTERDCPVLALAERYFSTAEVEAMRALPAACQRQRFFDLWTLKEAYVKARGLGLGIPLNSFGFEFGPQLIGATFNNDTEKKCASHWQFWQSRVAPAHTLGLAYSGTNRKIVRRLQAYTFIPLGPLAPQSITLPLAVYAAS